MKEIKVKLTFIEPVLGTCPGDPDIYRTFVASNSPDAATMEDEVAAIGVDGVVEKGKTVFPKLDDGTPFFYDYQIKGFFKDTCGGLRKVKETKSSSIKAFKKEIDKLILWNLVLFRSCLTERWASAAARCGRRRCRVRE